MSQPAAYFDNNKPQEELDAPSVRGEALSVAARRVARLLAGAICASGQLMRSGQHGIMRRSEQILVGLDAGAAAAMLRLGLGYVIGGAWLFLGGLGSPEWTVLPFFLAVLLIVRLVPTVIRKTGRFSEPVRSVWTYRRRLAKRFDSYQWQKLFWIGAGLTLRLASSGRRPAALVALTVACLVAGTLGLATWRLVRTMESKA